MLCMLLGPSVALTGEGTGAGGYADKFNMRSITIPAIAFSAAIVSSSASTDLACGPWPPTNIFIQARHALTADSKFTWTASTTRFSYLGFYNMIIATVMGWPQTDKTQLIQWWNGCVLICRYLLLRIVDLLLT